MVNGEWSMLKRLKYSCGSVKYNVLILKSKLMYPC